MSNPEDEIENTESPELSVDQEADVAAIEQEQEEVLEEVAGDADLDTDAEQAEASEQAAKDDMDSDKPESGDYQRFSQVLKNAQEISSRLEVLVPGVLDTADATNSAADVSRRASSALENGLDHLQKRVNELVDASAKSAVMTTKVMLGAVTTLLVAVGIIAFLSIELSSRVEQVDGMMVALSKRVVKMNSALQTFEQMNFSINQLAMKQSQFASDQLALAAEISKTEQAIANLSKQVPTATAQTVRAETGKVAVQIQQLNTALKAQGAKVEMVTGTVKKLGTQIKTFDRRIQSVANLNADVEALVALERNNYLEVLQRQVALQEVQDREDQPEADPSIVVYPKIKAQR